MCIRDRYSACQACPNPAAYYIWDPASASSSTSISLPPATNINGAYVPVRFRNVSATNFNFIPGKSVLSVSGNFKIVGTVSSFVGSELAVNVTGYSGTGTSSNAWTITPHGCDTVIQCQGHMKSSTDFTRCEGCTMPASGYIWAGASGCETLQCTGGLFPSADLSTCTNVRTPCTSNTQCVTGQTCGSNGQCTACTAGATCLTCPTSTPKWNGTACF